MSTLSYIHGDKGGLPAFATIVFHCSHAKETFTVLLKTKIHELGDERCPVARTQLPVAIVQPRMELL
jgi:hypothetical protein